MKFTTILPIVLLPTSVTANRDLFRKARQVTKDNTEFGRDDATEFGRGMVKLALQEAKKKQVGHNLRTRSLEISSMNFGDFSMSMPDVEASMGLNNIPSYFPTYVPTTNDVSLTLTTTNEEGSATITQVNIGSSATHTPEELMTMLLPPVEADVPTYYPTHFPTGIDGSTAKLHLKEEDISNNASDTVSDMAGTVNDVVETVSGTVDAVNGAVDTVSDTVDTVSDVADTVNDATSTLDGVLQIIWDLFGGKN